MPLYPWCNWEDECISILKMMKKYFERSLNGSPWRNSAASLLLHLYNFIKSIENAGNSVSVTAVRAGGWSSVLTPVTHPPSRRNADKMSQIVTKCYTSTTIIWLLECQKRKLNLNFREEFSFIDRYIMLSEMIMTLFYLSVISFSQFWLFGYFWQIGLSRG